MCILMWQLMPDVGMNKCVVHLNIYMYVLSEYICIYMTDIFVDIVMNGTCAMHSFECVACA